MKKIIEWFVKLTIYATFVMPLVLLPSSFIFPFIVPKILFFRSLILLLVAGYIALLVLNFQEYRPRLTWVTVGVGLFLASFLLSTFIGVDSYHSFWDNHERMLGLFTLFHYVIYYLIATAVFKRYADWRIALQVFLALGSVVMFIGVIQHFNPDFLLNQGSVRVSSTLGNAIYVGGYGLFLAFVGLLLFMKEKVPQLRLLQGVFILLALVGMILSGTRGSLLGFFAGIGGVLLGYGLLAKDHPRLRQATLGAVALLVAVLGILYINRQTTFVRSIPTLGGLLNISLSGGTASTRLIAWKIAIESWKERPVFGWGPNNFFYAFNKYYNPASLEHGYGETWFDNAHNIILNTLTVQGLFGVISYLAMFGLGWFTLLSRSRKPGADLHVVIIGSGFLLAHLVQNITVFENPTSYLYFFFWLAMVNRLGSPQFEASSKIEHHAPDRPLNAGVLGVIGVTAVLFIYIFNIQPARANQKTLLALQKLNQDPVGEGLATMQSALQFNSPHIDDIRSDVSRTAAEVLSRYYQKLTKEQSNQLIDIAVAALQKNISLHTADIRTYLLLGQLLQTKAIVNNDGQYVMQAEQYLETALGYSPKRQQILFTLANLKVQINKVDQAAALLEQAIKDNPKISESYWRLAYLYKLANRQDLAKAVFAKAHADGVIFDDQGKQVEAMIAAEPSAATDKK